MSGLFEYGARFEILRTGLTNALPTYRATISWPEDQRAVFTVQFETMEEYALVSEDETTAEPEEWMEAHLSAMLGVVVKGGSRTGKWPRRLNVWKESPSAS